MKAEATPPSNPPPKKFVKPVAAPVRAVPTRTSTAVPTVTVMPTTTLTPSASAASQTRTISPNPNEALQKQERRKAAEQRGQQMEAQMKAQQEQNKAKARGRTKSARADKTAKNRGTTKAPGTAQNGSATKGRHGWNNSSVSFCSIAEHYPRFPVASPRLALAFSGDYHSIGERNRHRTYAGCRKTGQKTPASSHDLAKPSPNIADLSF
jgi:hypothetical protein